MTKKAKQQAKPAEDQIAELKAELAEKESHITTLKGALDAERSEKMNMRSQRDEAKGEAAAAHNRAAEYVERVEDLERRIGRMDGYMQALIRQAQADLLIRAGKPDEAASKIEMPDEVSGTPASLRNLPF